MARLRQMAGATPEKVPIFSAIQTKNPISTKDKSSGMVRRR
jgi:hypothetical protein